MSTASNLSASSLSPTSSPVIAKHSPSSRRADGSDAFWEADERVTACSRCDAPFTFVTRKHHCRRCGSIVCSQCSQGKLPSKVLDEHPIAGHPPDILKKDRKKPEVRVCDTCRPAGELRNLTKRQLEAERKTDRMISSLLSRGRQTAANTCKLLLLGSGDSGKSTILQQMKIMNLKGFSQEERMRFRPLVFQNVFEAMQNLLRGARACSLPLDSPENEQHAQAILAIDLPPASAVLLEGEVSLGASPSSSPGSTVTKDGVKAADSPPVTPPANTASATAGGAAGSAAAADTKTELPPAARTASGSTSSSAGAAPAAASLSRHASGEAGHIVPSPVPFKAALSALWRDRGVQLALARSNEFESLDSAPYFLADVNLERICAPSGYVPSDDDILRSRKPTTGTTSIRFDARSTPFEVFDVGGQRGQRKRWIQVFAGDAITAILWIASLSEFDQQLSEQPDKNRLDDSLDLFESICSLPWIRGTPVILFLNKMDLLPGKLQRHEFSVHHPEFHGSNDYKTVVAHVKQLYIARYQRARDPSRTSGPRMSVSDKRSSGELNALGVTVSSGTSSKRNSSAGLPGVSASPASISAVASAVSGTPTSASGASASSASDGKRSSGNLLSRVLEAEPGARRTVSTPAPASLQDLYVFETIGTDTKTMKLVIDSCFKILLNQALEEAGLR